MPPQPIELTEEQKQQLKTLAQVADRKVIAEYFGIHPDTFDNIRKRDPEVDQIYKKGKAAAIVSVAGRLLTKARAGDNACMFFYLKTQAGWRETQHVEVSRKSDIPEGAMVIPKEQLDMLPIETLEKLEKATLLLAAEAEEQARRNGEAD